MRIDAQALLVRFEKVGAAAWPTGPSTSSPASPRLALLLEDAVPARGLPVDRMRAAWNDFRLEVLPAYEQLAAALRPLDIHIPSLRPTNYTRNVYHVANGVMVLLLVHHALPGPWLLPVAAAGAGLAWTCELTRRRSARVNAALMWLFSRVAHPHEAFRVNSATWFATAMVVLAVTGDLMLITIALAILAVGDPVAALVGRRFGTIKLVNGRSLQGTLAFVAVATAAAALALSVYFPDLGAPRTVALAATAGTAGALAELFARRVDDNLAIPAASAAAAAALRLWLG